MTVPDAVAALVITGGEPAGLTVRVRVAVPVPLALMAFKVTALVPDAVGVPVIAPLAVLTDRPDGSPVAL